jgi:type I restriction enzyme S subunit
MSYFDKLIAELSRAEVRHVALSEVAGCSSTRVDASGLDETSFVGVDNLVADKGGRVDASYLPNTVRLTAYEPGDILLGNIRPYLKKVWLADGDGGCSGDVLAIRVKQEFKPFLDTEFLYYLLSSDGFFAYNMQHAKGAKMPRGNKTAILNYRIPVPLLEVQREIVRILDQFAQLEAALEAELEARRRQYKHYSAELLDLVNDPHHALLRVDEICAINRGVVISKDYLRDHHGPFPVYSSQTANEGVFGYIDTFAFDDEESITWTTDGANAGSVFYHQNKKFTITNVCGRLVVRNSMVLTRYLFFQLRHRAKAYVHAGMGNPKLMANHMGAVEIPVPPLDEQHRVVSLLDKFDSLLNDLSVGLPAELSARRKQFEYYRDRLLTFQEAAV